LGLLSDRDLEDEALLEIAVSELPEPERFIIEKRLEGLSQSEIAKLLNIRKHKSHVSKKGNYQVKRGHTWIGKLDEGHSSRRSSFLLMAFAFYLVVRNLSTIYGWIVFLAWLTFAMYVVEAAARLFKVQKRFAALVG